MKGECGQDIQLLQGMKLIILVQVDHGTSPNSLQD
jgi:hypothetical protein